MDTTQFRKHYPNGLKVFGQVDLTQIFVYLKNLIGRDGKIKAEQANVINE